MPAKSEKQKRFMDAAAHNPEFAKKAGIPSKVAKDFSEASIGMKFKSGGAESQAQRQSINNPKTNHGDQALFAKGGKIMDKADIKQDKTLIKKAFGMHDKQLHEGKKTNLTKLAGGGMAKETMGPRTMSKDVEKGSNKLLKHGESAVQKRGHTKGEEPKMEKFARGGGIESKGKTKGKMVTMCGGGMAKKK